LDARNKERLEWLADEVTENGGEASIWLADAGSSLDHRSVAMKLATAVAEEYRAVEQQARAVVTTGPSSQRRTAARLRRELAKIRQHDYFPTPDRDRAICADEELAQQTAAAS
jgi:hypothetical protein